MEQVIRRREELRQQEACFSVPELDSLSDNRSSSSDDEDFVRATRSRVKSRLQHRIPSKSVRLKTKLAPPVVPRMTSVSAGEQSL
jgi:dsDNA-specific endonuclease/ATPase MutS2